MLGERTGQRFRLGDRVRVKLVRADLESNRIDFVLAQEARGPRLKKPAGKTAVPKATATLRRVEDKPVSAKAKPRKVLAKEAPKAGSKKAPTPKAKLAARKASTKAPTKRR